VLCRAGVSEGFSWQGRAIYVAEDEVDSRLFGQAVESWKWVAECKGQAELHEVYCGRRRSGVRTVGQVAEGLEWAARCSD
jgi:hypothetical protein